MSQYKLIEGPPTVHVDDVTLTLGGPSVSLTKDQADRVRALNGVSIKTASKTGDDADTTGD